MEGLEGLGGCLGILVIVYSAVAVLMPIFILFCAYYLSNINQHTRKAHLQLRQIYERLTPPPLPNKLPSPLIDPPRVPDERNPESEEKAR